MRPWQHVLEPLSGYLLLAAKLRETKDSALAAAWNFDPQPASTRPVRDLVEAMIAAWGSGSWSDESHALIIHKAGTLRLSIDKAVTELGWRPRWDFATGVTRTANWFKANCDHQEDMQAVCEADIKAYEGTLV